MTKTKIIKPKATKPHLPRYPVNNIFNLQRNQAENNPKRSYQRNQEELLPLPMPLKEMYAK
jgi:hypothetical protein